MERKRNRNALRSMNVIMEAYVCLLKETPMEKITVTAIVNKAGLNRSTFYAHFTSPDDVQKMLEQKLVEDFLEALKDFDLDGLIKDPQPFLNAIAERIDMKMNYVKLMFEKHPASLWLNRLREAVIDKFMSDPNVEKYGDNKLLLIKLRFFVGGYISLCRDVLSNNLSGTLTDFNEILSDTISAGLNTESSWQQI